MEFYEDTVTSWTLFVDGFYAGKFCTRDAAVRQVQATDFNSVEIYRSRSPKLTEYARTLLRCVRAANEPHEKIRMIKDIRMISGCGLKEAKDLIEFVEK